MGLRTSPVTAVASGTTSACSKPVLLSGYCRARRTYSASMPAFACGSVAPGASRPTTSSQRTSRLCGVESSPRLDSGIQTSTSAAGNSKPGGITPTTSKGVPSSTSGRPRIERSPLNRRFHSDVDRTATWFLPSRSSSGVRRRPSAAGMPSVSKNAPSTAAAGSRSGSPAPVSEAFERPGKYVHADTDARPGCAAFRSSTSCGEKVGRATTVSGRTCPMRTSRSGSRKGSGRRRTPLAMLKIAITAPIPSASVARMSAVKPGFLRNARRA